MDGGGKLRAGRALTSNPALRVMLNPRGYLCPRTSWRNPLCCVNIQTRILQGVSGFVTGCPSSIWGRGLISLPMYVNIIVANLFQISWHISSIECRIVVLYHVKYILISPIDINWHLSSVVSLGFFTSRLALELTWVFVLLFPIDATL